MNNIDIKEEIKKNGCVFIGELVETSNEMIKSKNYVGKQGLCAIGDILYIRFEDERFMRTSPIEDINYKNDMAIIVTLNSIYKIRYISATK